MANNLHNSIKNGLLASSRLNNVATNSPANTSPKYSKYNDEATAYYHEYAPYASNVFEAEIQGLDYDNFYSWKKVLLRSSNVINPSTGENLSTSWQSILILDRKVDFIPIGAYVKYNNSVWIVYNPDNIASPTGNTIVIRCNTTYNTLDYYGNIVKTPMFLAKGTVLASSPYYMELSATLDGYQHVIMQLNDVTEKITNNTRIILGKSAFGMYGVSDFPEEFTADPNSCHIFRADLRLQETIEADDLVNHVADGKYFRFTLDIGGNNLMYVGEPQTLTVTARRNEDVVQSTTENPITYVWKSSNEAVATVDENGLVTPISVGSCRITCSLQQNESITSDFIFNVEERAEQSYVDFVSPIPQTLRSFETLVIQAKYFENGEETDDDITYSFSGADEDSYSFKLNSGDGITETSVDVAISSGALKWSTPDGYSGTALSLRDSNIFALFNDPYDIADMYIEDGTLYAVTGNRLIIYTWKPSDEPLVITASCKGKETSATITLLGY